MTGSAANGSYGACAHGVGWRWQIEREKLEIVQTERVGNATRCNLTFHGMGHLASV
jgi:hypothetical protein